MVVVVVGLVVVGGPVTAAHETHAMHASHGWDQAVRLGSRCTLNVGPVLIGKFSGSFQGFGC